MSGSQLPGNGDVELPDLNLHRRLDGIENPPETISGPSGREAKKRTKDPADSSDESDFENGRPFKQPKLEPKGSDHEDENTPSDQPSEKAKGKRPARSPEVEVVSPKPDLDHVQGSQPEEPPQTQFDDRERSPTVEPLTAYTCPICFGVVTSATMTPCGHVCCGECLFNAVEASMSRARFSRDADGTEARCPVCRARISGWDGVGGGVIGLIPRTVIAL